jgi:hypothetical protein
MALVEILDVSASALNSERLWGRSIDVPKPGNQADVYTIDIEGWVLSRESPAVAVEVVAEDRVIHTTSSNMPRPDVTRHYPNVPGVETCGFRTAVDVDGMTAEFVLGLQAVLQDGSRVSLGEIRGRHRPLCSSFSPELPPLMDTELLQIYPVQICTNPIFIIGSPRSGTTILGWSLAQHSHLWTSDESQILYDLFSEGRVDENYRRKEQSGGSWLLKQGIERAEFIRFLGLGINALFSSRSQGRRWLDHTPHYTLIVDILAEMFPGAFFLHMLRDGRRVVHSMNNFNNRFGDGCKADMLNPDPWFTDFREACKAWRHFVEISMNFCARYPTRCLTVVHEELVINTQKSFGKIFQFLRVPYEDAPVNYYQSYRINSSFHGGAAQPASVPSLPELWNEWTLDQKKIFLEEAADTLTKYGLATEGEQNFV